MGFNPAFLCRLARIEIGGWIEILGMGFSPSEDFMLFGVSGGSKPPTVRIGFSPSAVLLIMSAAGGSKPPPYEWALVHPISVVWHDFILEFGMILF